ncbi:NADP-dependent oxidoreductase [Hamadaea sp. NPDC051192]|uniref:NADP-dependent oxidoreductase n=1 Tax=Hamadaea sp. NPDC051192 TaxID=3154940 RepID=UPI003414320B
MQAARIHAFGDPSVIRLDDVARPVPGPGEVLLEVAATSVNPSEIGLRSGWLTEILPVTLPYTLGWDVAGTISAIGPGVRGLTPGDRVIGQLDGGAAAEYAVAPAELLVRAPHRIALRDAAALPIAGLTAWQAIDRARIQPGRRVLVNGAGGGVGGLVVQLARHAGGHVIATASARSADAVRRLGAHEIVDYTAGPVADAVTEPVDVLLHLVPDSGAEVAGLVRPGGVIVSITTEVAADGARSEQFVMRRDPAQLADLVRLVDAGVVSVDIADVWPLSEIAAVHADAEAGRLRGKALIVPSAGGKG